MAHPLASSDESFVFDAQFRSEQGDLVLQRDRTTVAAIEAKEIAGPLHCPAFKDIIKGAGVRTVNGRTSPAA